MLKGKGMPLEGSRSRAGGRASFVSQLSSWFVRACPESIFMIPMASGEPAIEIKARRP